MVFSLAFAQRVAIGILLIISVLAVAGFSQLRLNSHYSAYFDDSDERLITHRDVSELYSRHDSLFIVLQANDSFLNADHYTLLEELSALLARQAFVGGVLSISELGLIGDTLSSTGDYFLSGDQLREHGQVYGLLLSEDELTAGIDVPIRLEEGNAGAVLDAVGEIRRLVANTIAGTWVSAHYTGTLALNEAYIQVVRHDLARIVPLLFGVMFLVSAWLLGSWRAALNMLPVGVISVLIAFGVAGFFRAELAAIHAFVPVIIVSISMAGCMHVTLTYMRASAALEPVIDTAREAIKVNLLPMSLANGTTVLGFLGLAFSPSPPIRLVGYLVAVGVLASFLLCLTALPSLLSRSKLPRRAAIEEFLTFGRLAAFFAPRRFAVATLYVLVALPAAWLASTNVVGDNVLDYFVPSHAFYRDTSIVDEKLSGVNEVMYSVETNKASGMFQADAVEAVDRLARWLAIQPEVKEVTSISNAPAIMEARLDNRLQERLNFYKERLTESATEDPLLRRSVSADFSSSLVTAFLEQLDSRPLIDFDQRVQQFASDNLVDFSVRSAGPPIMFANLGEQNIRSMMTALTAALLLAALALGAAMRSWRIVWVGVICNILPILLIFSIWAVANGRISLGAAVVLGMVLGILLDDSIYLLATYRRARKSGVVDPIAYSLQRIGPALVVTSAALVAGLSLGLMSEFGPIWNMSVLSVSIIATALVIDLTLLPVLLPTGDRRRTTS